MSGVSIVDQMPSNAGASSLGTGGLTHSFTNNGLYMMYQLDWGKQSSLAGTYTVQGVQYGGVAMNPLVNVTFDSDKSGFAVFDLIKPLTGANDFVVASTPNTVNGVTTMIGGAITFKGQAGVPLVASQTTSRHDDFNGQPTALATPGSTKLRSIIMWACGAGSAFTAGSGGSDKTLAWQANVNGNSAAGNGMMATTPGNGSAITCTFQHTSDWAQIACFEIVAAPDILRRVRQAFQRGLITHSRRFR